MRCLSIYLISTGSEKLLLRGISRDDVQRGQVLAAEGTLVPRSQIETEVYVLAKAEGGRHTSFGTGYQPQFFFGTTDVTGRVEVLDADMATPGDGVRLSVSLQRPVACEEGSRFAIREGNRTKMHRLPVLGTYARSFLSHGCKNVTL